MNTKYKHLPCINCITLGICKNAILSYCEDFLTQPYDISKIDTNNIFGMLAIFSMEDYLCSIAKNYIESCATDEDHKRDLVIITLNYLTKPYEQYNGT